MLIFGIDTCCNAATAALLDDDRLVAQTVINHGKTHSQIMMSAVEDMFKAAQLSPRDVEAFAAATGPGSFTGVRIGVATAKAMAQAANRPCVAVSTLEALAYSSKMFDGIVAPILDARRNQVYNALFDCKKGEMTRLCDDRALALSELLDELSGYDRDVLFMGDGIFVFEREIKERLKDRACFAPKTVSMNLAGGVAAVAAEKYERGETVSYSEMIPSYLRLSQAERDRLEKLKQEK
jgi:tRNA threonylcarbamoyladenosine biosynthesis protein TsaB